METFSEKGYVEEVTQFGGQALTYSLKRSEVKQLAAQFNNNHIALFMPALMADEWIETEIVGFDNNSDLLYLLIEKDFKCLDNVAEDQSDNYPNPLLKINKF
jgi:hypothetical protein